MLILAWDLAWDQIPALLHPSVYPLCFPSEMAVSADRPVGKIWCNVRMKYNKEGRELSQSNAAAN